MHRLARRGCAEEIGDGFDFAKIVGLKLDREAGALADGSVQIQVGLRRAEVAVVDSKLLALARIGCVQSALDGNWIRDRSGAWSRWLATGSTLAATSVRRALATPAWIVASVWAMRSSKVFPHVAVAVAFSVPAIATGPVDAAEPIMRFALASEIPCKVASNFERESPPMFFIVP